MLQFIRFLPAVVLLFSITTVHSETDAIFEVASLTQKQVCEAALHNSAEVLTAYAKKGGRFNFSCKFERWVDPISLLQAALWTDNDFRRDSSRLSQTLSVLLQYGAKYQNESLENLLFVDSPRTFRVWFDHFLKLGFRPNDKPEGYPFLVLAIGNNAPREIVLELMAHPAIDLNAAVGPRAIAVQHTPLTVAISKRNLEYVRTLLWAPLLQGRKAPDVNYVIPAIRDGQGNVNHGTGITVLTYTLMEMSSWGVELSDDKAQKQEEYLDILRLLVKAGADPVLNGPASINARQYRRDNYTVYIIGTSKDDIEYKLKQILDPPAK